MEGFENWRNVLHFLGVWEDSGSSTVYSPQVSGFFFYFFFFPLKPVKTALVQPAENKCMTCRKTQIVCLIPLTQH